MHLEFELRKKKKKKSNVEHKYKNFATSRTFSSYLLACDAITWSLKIKNLDI